MKQLRWKDFSLVSKIVIEVGMIAVLLFAMNMLFYVRINNSMQKMDNVYASNAELTELSQVFEKVQDNMYKYLKVKSSQTLLDYYQNEAKYRNELEKLNEDNINDPVKLLERNIRKMSETYLDCTAETVAAKRGRNVEQYKRKYDDATKLYRYIQSSIDELNNLMFQENSSTYAVLRAVMRYLEISNSVIMIIIVAGGMLLLIQASSSSGATLSKAVFSISAIIAGVANTSIVPLPIAFAVLSKVTVISFLPLIPVCNISVSLYLYYKINPSIFTPQCPVKNKFINFSQFQKYPIHAVFCRFVSTHYF